MVPQQLDSELGEGRVRGNSRQMFLEANGVQLRLTRVNLGGAPDNLSGGAVSLGFTPEQAIVLPHGALAGA